MSVMKTLLDNKNVWQNRNMAKRKNGKMKTNWDKLTTVLPFYDSNLESAKGTEIRGFTY